MHALFTRVSTNLNCSLTPVFRTESLVLIGLLETISWFITANQLFLVTNAIITLFEQLAHQQLNNDSNTERSLVTVVGLELRRGDTWRPNNFIDWYGSTTAVQGISPFHEVFRPANCPRRCVHRSTVANPGIITEAVSRIRTNASGADVPYVSPLNENHGMLCLGHV